MDDNTLETIIAFAIIAVILIGIFIAVRGGPSEPEEQRINIAVGDDPTLGSPQAPITIIEFSDFECAFCAEFATNTKPLLDEYIENGTVRFVFKDFPLSIHAKAPQLAKAAGCAQEQDKFWEYHDLLYENMDEHELSHLDSYANQTGLNMTEFETCFRSDVRSNEVENDLMQGREFGVQGTPTFFFNGRRVVGALSQEELVNEIEKELATTLE